MSSRVRRSLFRLRKRLYQVVFVPPPPPRSQSSTSSGAPLSHSHLDHQGVGDVDDSPPYHPPLKRSDFPSTFSNTIPVFLSPYGRKHSYSGVTWAVDYPVSAGTPVYAHADGRVTKHSDEADQYNGIGVWIVADSGKLAGMPKAFIHLSYRLVSRDDKVRRGQLIGYTGSTGASDGPHLHDENGAMVDPLDPTLFDWVGAGWEWDWENELYL